MYKRQGIPTTNHISRAPKRNTLAKDKILISLLVEETLTIFVLMSLETNIGDRNKDKIDKKKKKAKKQAKENKEIEKLKNVIRLAPTKKPKPFTVFFEPVSHVMFLNKLSFLSSSLKNFIDVLLATFVKSLATPQSP